MISAEELRTLHQDSHSEVLLQRLEEQLKAAAAKGQENWLEVPSKLLENGKIFNALGEAGYKLMYASTNLRLVYICW